MKYKVKKYSKIGCWNDNGSVNYCQYCPNATSSGWG